MHQIPKRWSMNANIALHPNRNQREDKDRHVAASRWLGGAEEGDRDAEKTTRLQQLENTVHVKI